MKVYITYLTQCTYQKRNRLFVLTHVRGNVNVFCKPVSQKEISVNMQTIAAIPIKVCIFLKFTKE